MIAYSLYTILAIGLAILVSAVFRGLRRDDERIASSEEDAAFARRMKEIEAQYDYGRDQRPGRAHGDRIDPK